MAEQRIQKVLSDQGVCSRRAAEKLIDEGRVKVNGHPVTLGDKMDPDFDKVSIDGKSVRIVRKRQYTYLMLNKPRGYITTASDERGRKTVMDLLTGVDRRVYPIGRLDKDSEGLLLLTNNGELSHKLELPENGWSRRYKVKVHGYVDLKRLSALEKGAVVDGVSYGPVKAEVETEKGTNAWLIVTLSEGKNREIRKLMKSIGLDVARLIRLSYGPFQLGSLKKGEVREVPGKVLKEQLGSKFQL